MNDLCAAFLQGTVFVSRGRFRLDRERALDKLAHFTLATPEFYVLELVAAGVRSGASPLSIRCDSNDFVIAWEGGLQPTPTELTNLLDWLFNRGASDRARMLQHLAQGIHGARGLDPQWIRVSLPATQATPREQAHECEQARDPSDCDTDESVPTPDVHGGALLDLTDLRGAAKQLEAPKSSSETSRFEIHIRRPLGRGVVRAFFRATVRKQLPAEVQAILSHAHGIALDIDDHDRDALSEYAAEAVAVAPSRTLASRGEGHELWVNFGSYPRENNHVVLLRDGIRVASIEVKTSDIFLCGQIRCDALTLDASRAQVVEDASFRALRARLYTELGQLIHRRLRNLSDHHRLRPRLQRGLLILLYDHDEAARGLHHVPALRDASGRRWSLAQLARSGRILSFRPDSLAHSDIAEPHFVAREALPGWVADDPMSPEVLQWRLLERHFTNVIHEASAELESRAIGRIRRTYRTSVLRALHASVPGNLYKHNFERATPERQPTTAPQAPLAPESRSQPNAQTGADGITRGVVFLIDGETIPRTCMRVELHVDGLPCETVDLEYPGPLYARISSPDLRAHDDFARVIHDQAYEAALDLARQQADTMAFAIAQTLDAVGLDPDHAERRLLAFICNWLQHQQPPEGLRSAAKINAWLPAPIVSLRLFAHLVSSSSAGSRPEVEAVSVKELLPKLWGEESQSSVCCVAQTIGTELVKPGTIVGPMDRLRLLAHVLGPRVREITQQVLDDRLATRRRASAWATPMLTAPAFGRVKFRAPGLYGELALALEEDEHNDALVTIIHAGVELGTFELPLGVPGCLGSVVWERAVPNRAWNGMLHREIACATIATELAPHLPELLHAGLAKLRPKPFTELPRWVVGLAQRTQALPEKLLAFELWTALDGQTFSTQSIVDTMGLSSGACLWTFSGRPVPEQRGRWSASTRLLATLLGANGQLTGAETSQSLGAAAALTEHRACLLAAFTRHLKNACPEKQMVAWPLPVWACAKRRALAACLVPGLVCIECDEWVTQLAQAWLQFIDRKPHEGAIGAGKFCAATVAIEAPELMGEVAVPLDEVRALGRSGLTIEVRLAARTLVTVHAAFPVPLRAVVWGPLVVPNLELTGLADSAALQAVLDVVTRASQRVFAQLCTVDTSPDKNSTGEQSITASVERHLAAPRRRLLATLLDPQGVASLGIDADQARTWIAQLGAQPIYRTLSGRFLSVHQIAARALRNEVAKVAPTLATAADPGGIQLVVNDASLQALESTGRLTELPDHSDRVSAHATVSTRPLEPLSPLELPNCPPVCAHATWTLAGTRIWAGLLQPVADAPSESRLEWMVEHRVLPAQPLTSPTPLWIRVTDLELAADSEWRMPLPGPATTRVTRLLSHVADALMAELLAELSGGIDPLAPEQRQAAETSDRPDGAPPEEEASPPKPAFSRSQRLVVTDPDAARAHLLLAGEGLAQNHQLFGTSGPTFVSRRQLHAWAHLGPIPVVEPGFRGRNLHPTRLFVAAGPSLRAAIEQDVGPILDATSWAQEEANAWNSGDRLGCVVPLPSGLRGNLVVTEQGRATVIDGTGRPHKIPGLSIPMTGVLVVPTSTVGPFPGPAEVAALEASAQSLLLAREESDEPARHDGHDGHDGHGQWELWHEILCRLCEAKREIPRELRRLSVFADNHGRHHRLDQLASRSQVLWVEPHPLAGEIPEVCVCLEATKVERLAGDIEWVEGPRALSPSRRVDMPGDLAIALDGAGFAASVSGVRCELPNGIAGVVTFGGLHRPSGIWVESGGITRRAELEIPGVRVALRRPLCDSNWLTLAQSQVLKTAIDRCLDQAAKGPLRQHGAWREPLVAHLKAPSCPSFVRGLKVFCGPKQQYYSLRDFAADPKVVLADPIEAEQLAPNPDRPCVLLDEPINRQLLAARGGRLEQMALVAWESQRMPKPGPEFTLVVYQRIEQLLEDLANPGRLTVSRALEAVCLRLPKVHARALRDPQGSACWLLAWQVSQALVIAYNENLHALCTRVAEVLAHANARGTGPRGMSHGA